LTDLSECILGHWIHSHEEESESVRVYRRSGYAFPPSRGRTGLEFRENGRLVYHGIRRGDGSEPLSGSWRLDGQNLIRIDVENDQVEPFTLVIMSCGDDILKVSKTKPG
jgi:hypothetical protein